MPPISRPARPNPNVEKALYTVVTPVQNLHIGGVKVIQWQTVALTEPAARHWLNEGVLQAGVVKEPEAAPAAPADEGH